MRKLRNSFLIAVVAVTGAFADASSQKPSVDVRRVGAHIGCQCGCVDTVATCAMLECSFSKPAKERIAKLQAAGTSDKIIIDQFVAELASSAQISAGEARQRMYRGDPTAFGWLVPYLLIAPGLALIWWFVKRYRRPHPIADISPAVEDPELAKYHEQIEKDLAHLE